MIRQLIRLCPQCNGDMHHLGLTDFVCGHCGLTQAEAEETVALNASRLRIQKDADAKLSALHANRLEQELATVEPLELSDDELERLTAPAV